MIIHTHAGPPPLMCRVLSSKTIETTKKDKATPPDPAQHTPTPHRFRFLVITLFSSPFRLLFTFSFFSFLFLHTSSAPPARSC